MRPVWFIRTNGETLHNVTGSPNYVEGEPPTYPDRKFDYRRKCIAEGFVRIGWPNAGNLRRDGAGRLCPRGYEMSDLPAYNRRNLATFSKITTGNLVVIPGSRGRGWFHLGVVVPRECRDVSPERGQKAYYFLVDVHAGDYYECAHRVSVVWATEGSGEVGEIEIGGLDGVWRKEFGKVVSAEATVEKIARNIDLID